MPRCQGLKLLSSGYIYPSPMIKVFDLQSYSFSWSGDSTERATVLLRQLRDVCEIDVTSEKPLCSYAVVCLALWWLLKRGIKAVSLMVMSGQGMNRRFSGNPAT